ncbi:MAG: class I SAM-dependent methyltransferase [Hyphomicrobiales bacterium]|nr:class I SAM-dependent methyltransferase [Hyphomicrobiales bacterium]
MPDAKSAPDLNTALDLDPAYAANMAAVLRDCGFAGLGTVLDFGCARGQWASALSGLCGQVIGVDISPVSLQRARAAFAAAGAGNATFHDLGETALESLPPLDGITCMDVLPLMAGRDIHALFRFARDRLDRGRPFLCSTRNPRLFLDWLMTGERFRYEGLGGGLRKYAGLATHVLRALARTPIADEPRARYLVLPGTLMALAGDYGFRVARGPAAMAGLDSLRAIEPVYAGPGRHFVHLDWYLLERT